MTNFILAEEWADFFVETLIKIALDDAHTSIPVSLLQDKDFFGFVLQLIKRDEEFPHPTCSEDRIYVRAWAALRGALEYQYVFIPGEDAEANSCAINEILPILDKLG